MTSPKSPPPSKKPAEKKAAEKKAAEKKPSAPRRTRSATAVAEKIGREPVEVTVRRIHRRDLNRTWEFLKNVFRDVNRTTVEYQRQSNKRRFFDVYEDQSVEQLLFEVDRDIVGYSECSFDTSGDDNWLNPRYFAKREMRPLYVEELAVHPDYQGQGVGAFILDQLHHLARIRGCTHLVLEVAENNERALAWYRKRNFFKLDAAIFMAQKVSFFADELLPPRTLVSKPPPEKSQASDAVKRAAAAHKPKIAKKRTSKAATVLAVNVKDDEPSS